jgi:hypothetical protein
VQLALATGEFGGLGELPVLAAEESLADAAELGADGAPGLVGAGLGDADDDEREEADQDVRADRSALL